LAYKGFYGEMLEKWKLEIKILGGGGEKGFGGEGLLVLQEGSLG